MNSDSLLSLFVMPFLYLYLLGIFILILCLCLFPLLLLFLTIFACFLNSILTCLYLFSIINQCLQHLGFVFAWVLSAYSPSFILLPSIFSPDFFHLLIFISFFFFPLLNLPFSLIHSFPPLFIYFSVSLFSCPRFHFYSFLISFLHSIYPTLLHYPLRSYAPLPFPSFLPSHAFNLFLFPRRPSFQPLSFFPSLHFIHLVVGCV